MSVLKPFGFWRTNLQRERCAHLRRRRLGFEAMEGRHMLAAPVSIDLSQNSAGATVSVSASGGYTIADINGVNVNEGLSANISSLTITGTSFNDSIAFNYGGGNPVPSGSITVNGNSGTDQLTVTGDANFSVANYVQLSGNISSFISFSNIEQVNAVAGSSSDLANIGAGSGSAGVFAGHLAVGSGGKPGASFHANDGSYYNVAIGFGVVHAFSSSSSDVAYLDDYYAGLNNAVSQSTVSWFGSSSLEDVTYNFPNVQFSAGYGLDEAFLDDANSSGGAFVTYSPMHADYRGPSYHNQSTGFAQTQMTGYYGSDILSLYDSTSAPGAFTSYPTYSYVTGTDNGTTYQGTGYFTHVYEAPTTPGTVLGNKWYDTLGGASIANNSSYGQPFITYSNGATVTYLILPNDSDNIAAYNETSQWDTITADAEFYVLPEGGHWNVNPI